MEILNCQNAMQRKQAIWLVGECNVQCIHYHLMERRRRKNYLYWTINGDCIANRKANVCVCTARKKRNISHVPSRCCSSNKHLLFTSLLCCRFIYYIVEYTQFVRSIYYLHRHFVGIRYCSKSKLMTIYFRIRRCIHKHVCPYHCPMGHWQYGYSAEEKNRSRHRRWSI